MGIRELVEQANETANNRGDAKLRYYPSEQELCRAGVPICQGIHDIMSFLHSYIASPSPLPNELTTKIAEYEEVKKRYIEMKNEMEELLKIAGEGFHWQDDDGTVYIVETPDFITTHVPKTGYKRTRKAGERAGSLSLVSAKKLGYEVE